MLKYVPEIMTFVTDDFRVVREPVSRCIVHPVGHNVPAICKDWQALEVFSVNGHVFRRGTKKAFINSELRMVVDINPLDEVPAKWENASE